MELELTLKNKDNELLGKISAYSLESLEEQFHKIEEAMGAEEKRERLEREYAEEQNRLELKAKKKKELARETQREIIRDNYVDANREKLEEVFGQENPEILDDDLPDAFSNFVMDASLEELRKLIK